jgi:hypothetical protein
MPATSFLLFANPWNNGIVEKWNIGCEKADEAPAKILASEMLIKYRSHCAKPRIPTFHYSNIP